MIGSATFTIGVSRGCISVAAMIAVVIRTSEKPLSMVGYWLPSPGRSSAIRHLRRKRHCGLRIHSPQRPKSLRALAFYQRGRLGRSPNAKDSRNVNPPEAAGDGRAADG